MPFQSEQQRKYLWANEPAIAKRWEKYPKGYNTGGVSHLFRSKSAQGGYIRPEDSGVLGVADGGNIRLQPHTASDLLVQKISSGERPKYQPPGYSGPSGQETRGDTRGRDEPHHGDVAHEPGGRFDQPSAPVSKPDTTRDHAPPGEEGGAGYISPEDLQTLQFKEIIRREEEEKKDYVAPQKKKSFLGTLATAIAWYTGLAPLLGLQVPAVVQTIGTGLKMKKQLDYGVKEYNKRYGTNYSFDEFIAKTTDRLKKEHAERQKKMALYKSLPDGHPEKIQLQIDLQIGKKPEHLGDSGGDDIPTTIIEEDVSKYPNQEEMMAAAKRAYEMLYGDRRRAEVIPEDTRKRDAYLAAFRQKYLMGDTESVAQGGRVPGGYNTGGLSNLFRLKNT